MLRFMPAPRSVEGSTAESAQLDVSELGRLIRERRGSTSLRAAASAAGVSFSTLSRVEAGAQPDLASFAQLCAWLGVPPSRFFAPVAVRETQPLELAISHLRHDPNLDAGAKASISTVLTEMYQSLARQSHPHSTLVACHLRAASVMRPGVPKRLASLLQDMHAELERQAVAGHP